MSDITFLDEDIVKNIYKDVVKSSGSNIYGFINEIFKSVSISVQNLSYYENCEDIFILATKWYRAIYNIANYRRFNTRR